MQHSRVIVTGACGFIGSHVLDALAKSACSILGIDNLSTGSRSNIISLANNSKVEFRYFDICDLAKLESAFRQFRPTAVIHLSALVSVQKSIEDPLNNFKENIYNTQSLIHLCKSHSVSKFVFASSAAIYGDPSELPITEVFPIKPLSPYGMSKYAAELILEQYALNFELDYIALRFFNVYGERQDPSSQYSGVISKFTNQIENKQPITVFGTGAQTRDFVLVNDLAEIVVEAVSNPNIPSGSYNVCTGIPTTLIELVETIAKATNLDPNVTNEEARTGDIEHSFGSNEKLKEHFNFRKFTSLETGIGKLLNR